MSKGFSMGMNLTKKEVPLSPYKSPAPETKVKPKIRKEPKKQFSFCKDCKFVNENDGKNTGLWLCQSPSEFARNFQSGETKYKTVYCVTKNDNGECYDFTKKLPVALQKIELPPKEDLLIPRPSFFKRIFRKKQMF